ncbi:alpha-L-fucosidase [bacterium]|nr:alpha-L-fucosidase [bacterium]
MFEPTVESLMDYQCPEWFRNAKFGIYVHWGVYSVPAQGEWYARKLYIEGDPDYDHHVRTYGHPSKFGYRDFVPMWTAERFDPERLVSLFKQAGARYFTPCAVHHDNFDLWDSKHHAWNSVNMGPKMDITGLWRNATLSQGLRFGVTTHLARCYSWFNTNKGADKRGALKGVPYDGANPEYSDFYLEPHDDTDLRHPLNPPESWRQDWLRRMKDLIDHYKPDHMYFDGAVPFQGDDRAQTGLELLAYYYNASAHWRGQQDNVLCIKRISDHGYFFDGVATLDIERGRSGRIELRPWQTDTSIGPWGYKTGATYRPVTELVLELVDIVSKNGNLLLNVPPRADGTLDDETEAILAGIGRWMDVNGEAIYDTRPWRQFGEGAVRFTAKDDILYAIFPPPEKGDALTLAALGEAEGDGPILDVTMLGHDGPLPWTRDEDALTVALPADLPCEHASALRISLGQA